MDEALVCLNSIYMKKKKKFTVLIRKFIVPFKFTARTCLACFKLLYIFAREDENRWYAAVFVKLSAQQK